MDPVTVSQILKSSKLLIDALKRGEVIGKISAIQSTLDQLILREIKSAYEAISDALITTNEQTRNLRLHYAEESLLKNTNLDMALKTGKYKNTYLAALAHYGLAFTCSLRGDDKIAAIHILKSFVYDPRAARTTLHPGVYDEVLKPKCSNLSAWYQKRISEISNSDYTFRVVAGKTGAVLFGVGAVAAIAVRQIAVANEARKGMAGMWERSNSSRYRKGALDNLKIEMESKLDERCREIALELISTA